MNRNRSLSPEKVKRVLDYDPDSGVFTWKYRKECPPQWNTRFSGKVAGGTTIEGYVSIRIGKRRYLAHRLAFLVMTGSFPNEEIDHINGVRNDNRFANLREATSAENKRNSHHHKDSDTGLKGVRYHKRAKKYQARVNVDGKEIALGLFDTAEEAKTERDKVARLTHRDFFKS